MKLFLTVLALCALLLAACDQVQPLLGGTALPSTSLPQPTVTRAAPAQPPEILTPTEPGPTTLRLWVPPRFDPDSGDLAGELFRKRLNEFTQQHPGIELEVRVKALSGTGGLLNSLVTTSAAAPQAIPDVVALSREDLEAAAVKGLLHTYSGSTDIQDGPDWYDYARQLAQIQSSVYGLPFAGEVGLLAYRPESIPIPPADWSALLQNLTPMIFAAGDPDSIFTLTLYQARGGAIQDSQGQPYLEAAQLEEVLNFYAEARNLGVMPEWLVEIEDDQEAWDSFVGGAANQVFSWSSNYLSHGSTDLAITPTPTPPPPPSRWPGVGFGLFPLQTKTGCSWVCSWQLSCRKAPSWLTGPRRLVTSHPAPAHWKPGMPIHTCPFWQASALPLASSLLRTS